MLETLLSAVSGNSGMIIGGGSATIVLFVLKKIPNEHICGVVESGFESLGKVRGFIKGLRSDTK